MKKSAKTAFPDWFSPYFEPPAPYKPPKLIDQYEEISRKSFDIYSNFDLTQIPELATHLSVETENNYDDGIDYTMVLYVKKTIENPKYEIALKDYKEAYSKYKKQLKEWNECKALWDKQQKAEEKEQYLKLKKKYEKKR